MYLNRCIVNSMNLENPKRLIFKTDGVASISKYSGKVKIINHASSKKKGTMIITISLTGLCAMACPLPGPDGMCVVPKLYD